MRVPIKPWRRGGWKRSCSQRKPTASKALH